MSEHQCQQELRRLGRPYPRACSVCGLGPRRYAAPRVALVSGISRDAENECFLLIGCKRRPTDDEMRAIHNAARDAVVTEVTFQ